MYRSTKTQNLEQKALKLELDALKSMFEALKSELGAFPEINRPRLLDEMSPR